MNTIDPLICDKDGAAMLGCSVSSFWRRVREGVIPRPVKIGGMSRWPKSEIQSVIDKAKLERETV
jgi:predicted DNA-binding transcriptional regulator AlpA